MASFKISSGQSNLLFWHIFVIHTQKIFKAGIKINILWMEETE